MNGILGFLKIYRDFCRIYFLYIALQWSLTASTEIFALNIFYIANSEYSYCSCQICHYVYSLSICKFAFSIPCNYIYYVKNPSVDNWCKL